MAVTAIYSSRSSADCKRKVASKSDIDSTTTPRPYGLWAGSSGSKVECKIGKLFNTRHSVEVCYAYCGNNCLNCLDYLGLKTSLEQSISDSLCSVPCEEILSFIKSLEATRDELEKRIDTASDFEELTKGLVKIGQNWIFSGSVTDAGKQTLSKWQKR